MSGGGNGALASTAAPLRARRGTVDGLSRELGFVTRLDRGCSGVVAAVLQLSGMLQFQMQMRLYAVDWCYGVASAQPLVELRRAQSIADAAFVEHGTKTQKRVLALVMVHSTLSRSMVRCALSAPSRLVSELAESQTHKKTAWKAIQSNVSKQFMNLRTI